MNYIKLINGNPVKYSIAQLKQANPQVSFPSEIPEETLAQYGVFKVTKEEANFDEDAQTVASWDYVKVAKNWILRPAVRNLTPDEKKEIAKDKARSNISDSLLNIPAMTIELINILVARGIISRGDFTEKTITTYDQLKVASETINS